MQGLLQISCALSVLALVKVFQHRPSPAPAANLLLPSPQVTVRFDTILTVNNRLREEIKNLRIQKAILDNFYAKLRKHLDQQKNRMDAAVEQSTQAYEQRCAARAISVTGVRGKGDGLQLLFSRIWSCLRDRGFCEGRLLLAGCCLFHLPRTFFGMGALLLLGNQRSIGCGLSGLAAINWVRNTNPCTPAAFHLLTV